MADGDGKAGKHASKDTFDRRATAEMEANLVKTDRKSVV